MEGKGLGTRLGKVSFPHGVLMDLSVCIPIWKSYVQHCEQLIMFKGFRT